MFGIELIIILLTIYLGIKLKGVGISFASGFGLLILTTILKIKPGVIPFDVIEIMMTCIVTISVVQVAGGIDYLVNLAKRILYCHPKYIIFLAPLITWFMTILIGTGHTVFSTLPVITEVAKEYGIPPSRPLSIAVVASQIAVTASPISASVVFFAKILEPIGISYLTLLGICIPVTFIAIMITAIFCNFFNQKLKKNSAYQESPFNKRIVKLQNNQNIKLQTYAKRSIIIFILGIIAIVVYAALFSNTIGIIRSSLLSYNEVIIIFMLTTAMFISIACKTNTSEIIKTNIFQSGMNACICTLGVTWLGNTFLEAHISDIRNIMGELLQKYPWILAIILFFSSSFLYSQAATTKIFMPNALMLGVSPLIAISSFFTVSALFVLPTYPTLLAAVEIDDTGSTKIGKYLFNHTFLIPGIIAVFLCVIFGFIIGNILL